MSTTGMAVYEDANSSLSLWRKPEQVLAEAKEAATALISVISQKSNKVMFNGEQYIEREDWGTVAKFYGCTAKIVETRYVNYDGVRGFEAIAVCLDRNQNEISRAESMCLADETNWGDVPVYEWQDVIGPDGKKVWDPSLRNGKGGYKSNKVKTGTTPKPLFQLRSMAQTRAEAKVLKSVFGYVVVLAGYRPSVAEEMTGNEHGRDDGDSPVAKQEKPPVTQPGRASEAVVEEVSGRLTQAKFGANGALWGYVDGKLVAVNKDLVNDDMVEGGMLAVKAKKAKNDKVGEYLWAVEVIAAAPPENNIQEGEIVDGIVGDAAEVDPPSAQSADTTKQQTTVAEVAEPAQTASPAAAALGDIFKGGTVKPASQIASPEPAKPGTIGIKRAQRLHILITQNHKASGFTEERLKALMVEMKLEHLRDLPVDYHTVIEGYCNGTDTRWKGEG